MGVFGHENAPSGSGFGDLPLTGLPQVRGTFNLKGLTVYSVEAFDWRSKSRGMPEVSENFL
jgi:hypothetical protein